MGLNFETFQTKMSYYFWINNKNASATTNSKMALYWTVFKCLSYWGFFLSAHTNVTSVKRGGSFVIATFCPQVKYAFFIAVGVDQHALLPFLKVWTNPYFCNCTLNPSSELYRIIVIKYEFFRLKFKLIDKRKSHLAHIKPFAKLWYFHYSFQSQPYWGFKSSIALS